MPSLADLELDQIDRRKIIEYRLADEHPSGRFKAAYFRKIGFAATSWSTLADALLDHAKQGTVATVVESTFGTKYIVDGKLGTPFGSTVDLRAIWFRATTERKLKFVTAYPS